MKHKERKAQQFYCSSSGGGGVEGVANLNVVLRVVPTLMTAFLSFHLPHTQFRPHMNSHYA